jgi:hypothetical protein
VRRLDSPAVAALITAVFYSAFLLRLLTVRGGDVSIFVVAGGPGVDEQRVPPGLTVIPDIGGYDGQAFYRLALDPFTRTRTAYGVELDTPAYRQQRIGYPLLVWAFSLGGRPLLVPRMMVAVNLIALVAMAVVGAWFARFHGRHALWGLVFPFYPGFLMTLSRDLSEIVANCFALAAIVAITRRRFGVAVLLLSYAVISRETTVVVAMGLGAAWLFDKVRRLQPRVPAYTFIIPAAIYIGWQRLLAVWWGAPPMVPTRSDIAFPFSEYARVLGEAIARGSSIQRVYFAECAFLALVIVAVIVEAVRVRPPAEWLAAWTGHFAIASLLPPTVWAEDVAFMRVLGDVFVISAVIVTGYGSRAARGVLMLITTGLWCYLAGEVSWRG